MSTKIIKATKKNISEAGYLFDLYRQFYKYKSNIKASTNYIKDRINKKLILYDLYVDEKFRRNGIGRKLMNTAKKLAKSKKIKIVELSTATNNKKAQALYESLDYKRDKEYYTYFLEL